MLRLKILILFVLALMTASAVPAAAQSGVVWNAEYFNNTILYPAPDLKRQDASIGFDWGNGAPAPGISADNFSVRWGADPFFLAGTYRFWALADDKIRITIDFAYTPLIDTITNPSVGRIVSADITLSTGSHHIQVDYIEEGGNAYAFVTWANLASNPTGPNFPPLTNSNPMPVSGPWTAQYFANPSLFGSPTLIRTEVSPSNDWGLGSPVASIPSDNFSARWTSVQTLNAGTYQLSVRADDGVRVIINGVVYINEWHSATGQTYTVNVPLPTGTHSFIVDFYEASGAAFINYSFTLIGAGGGFATATPYLTGAYMTVTGAFRLNVRNLPDPVNGAVLTRISRNDSYPVVGRNANSTWWQINVNGVIGWVNARYVTAYNVSNVPVTSGGVVIVPTPTPVQITCQGAPAPRLVVGRYGRVTPGLPNNIRFQPDPNSVLLGQIPPGSAFYVITGPVCSYGFYWWQINYNGITGWTPEGGSGQYWVEPI